MTGYGFPVTIRRELSGAVSAWRSVTPPTALAKGGLAALGSGAEVGGGGLHFTVVFSGERSRHQEGSPRSLHLGRVPALCGPNCVGGIQASSASILGERKYARLEK